MQLCKIQHIYPSDMIFNRLLAYYKYCKYTGMWISAYSNSNSYIAAGCLVISACCPLTQGKKLHHKLDIRLNYIWPCLKVTQVLILSGSADCITYSWGIQAVLTPHSQRDPEIPYLRLCTWFYLCNAVTGPTRLFSEISHVCLSMHMYWHGR